MTTHKQKIELNAQKRTAIGGGLGKLRGDGFIPAVLYGKNVETLPLQVPAKDFNKVFESAGESTLVYLNVDGQVYPTIIHDVSRDPIKENVLHADFYKVRLDEKIKTMVQVVFEGESPAIKDFGGIFVRNINELEVQALPQDLPHEIVVNISGLKKMGDQILVKNLKLPENVELTANPDDIVATVQEPISEEELKAQLEAPTTAVEEVEEIKKEKVEEEAPAEEATTEEPKKE
ncbi:MAG: hypothetical protein A3J46_01770 [Candidatus Yanofskybacteria bacterium RIFCSPHIGHO2_02_FULL_41_11]|uniref:Large ribosomal subunit protein bL25 n=1 Tax=Candidatus Yanofskybacteria bacterium RIFCSPHIGHO2_02_FULL_41_11 TaxID=1802675 RepID=A0A1F8FB57_9BACT|nr:MAG: hypothetical protein A3J46_01770 [Candidatus Yanofskybacteria bacterium RIFCSPHIGHO2_02_FULL_41_11]